MEASEAAGHCSAGGRLLAFPARTFIALLCRCRHVGDDVSVRGENFALPHCLCLSGWKHTLRVFDWIQGSGRPLVRVLLRDRTALQGKPGSASALHTSTVGLGTAAVTPPLKSISGLLGENHPY